MYWDEQFMVDAHVWTVQTTESYMDITIHDLSLRTENAMPFIGDFDDFKLNIHCTTPGKNMRKLIVGRTIKGASENRD